MVIELITLFILINFFQLIIKLPGLVVSATQKSCNGLGSKAKTTKTKPRAMMLSKRKLVDILNLNLEEILRILERKL